MSIEIIAREEKHDCTSEQLRGSEEFTCGRLECFEDMTWQQVADRMGRKVTEASVKMEFKRFFEKN